MNQKRKSSRGASRQQSREPSGGRMNAYLAGVASGLFLAFLVYLASLPPQAGPQDGAAPEAAKRPRTPSPEFEFFEVLPSQEITVEVDPADLPKPRNADSKRYLLQAGSFRQADDADRRRGELLLLGLDPRVESTEGDTGRWFRVVIGPFESRSAMSRARSLTAQQDIDTLLIQRNSG